MADEEVCFFSWRGGCDRFVPARRGCPFLGMMMMMLGGESLVVCGWDWVLLLWIFLFRSGGSAAMRRCGKGCGGQEMDGWTRGCGNGRGMEVRAGVL